MKKKKGCIILLDVSEQAMKLDEANPLMLVTGIIHL